MTSAEDERFDLLFLLCVLDTIASGPHSLDRYGDRRYAAAALRQMRSDYARSSAQLMEDLRAER